MATLTNINPDTADIRAAVRQILHYLAEHDISTGGTGDIHADGSVPFTAAETMAGIIMTEATNIVAGTTTGTKIGTATAQKLALWNKTPIVQPTTAIAAATLVGGGGTTITDTDTFGGYTLQQVVKALQNVGILA